MSTTTPRQPPATDPALPRTPAAPQPPDSHSRLKEWTTALIGGGIVAVTLWIAVMLFLDRGSAPQWTAGQPDVPPERFDPFNRGKDVLLLLLPLAGAIVGYYTGRVVADRTVQQAGNLAQQATATAGQANAAAQTTRVAARQMVEHMGERALTALEVAQSPTAARGVRPRTEMLDEEGAERREEHPLVQAEREIRELMREARRWDR